MHLLDLPPELIILIIKRLDIESQIRIFETFTPLQCLIPTLRKLTISRREIRSTAIFQRHGFNLVANNIQEMDLTGVTNISGGDFVTIENMKNLRKLDVSFTNLLLKDIIRICPKSVNHITLTLSAEDNILLRNSNDKANAKKFFQKFHYIHFKQKPDFFDTSDTFYCYVLKDSPEIKEIKVSYLSKTAMAVVNPNVELGAARPMFKKIEFNFNFLLPILAAPAIHEFDNKPLEYFIYNFDQKNSSVNVIVSPMIKDIVDKFRDKLKIKVDIMTVLKIRSLLDFPFYGQITFVIFNKNMINHNEISDVIINDIVQLLPNHICLHENTLSKIIINDLNPTYIIHDCRNEVEGDFIVNGIFSNRNSVNPRSKVTIVHECICGRTEFSEDDDILPFNQSKLQKNYICAVSTMNNITFLTLHNVNFVPELWMRLFSNCKSLETLNIIIIGSKLQTTHNYEAISEYLFLSKNLRNFRLSEKRFNHEVLFKGISKCKKLEIVEIDCVYPVREIEYVDGTTEIPYDIETNIWHVSNTNFMVVLENCLNLKILVLDNFFRGNKKVRENVQKALQTFALLQKREDLNIIVSCNAPYINYSSEKECVSDIFYPYNRLLRY